MITKSLVSEVAKKILKCKIKSILKKGKYTNMQGIIKENVILKSTILSHLLHPLVTFCNFDITQFICYRNNSIYNVHIVYN